MPFIAVIMLLLIGVTAYQFGLSAAYLSRTRVRDALDSAVLSAASMANKTSSPTRYGEKRKTRKYYDSEGNLIRKESYWVKTTSSNEDYITINKSKAREIAEEYLHKNLHISNVKNYNVISLDIKIVEETNMLQVKYYRPNTEGVSRTYQENFPRWIRIVGKARVEVPAPLGGVFGRDRMVVQIESESRANLRNIPRGVWN